MTTFAEFNEDKRKEMARWIELKIADMYGINVCVDISSTKISVVDDYSVSVGIQCEVLAAKEKFNDLETQLVLFNPVFSSRWKHNF